MLALAPATTIYLSTEPTDMRKGFDGLCQIAAAHIQKNVLNGGLFVFINRRRDRVKLLWWQEDGLCIWYKRLEQGTFELPHTDADATSITLTPTQLALILGGVELASARPRKRYRRSA